MRVCDVPVARVSVFCLPTSRPFFLSFLLSPSPPVQGRTISPSVGRMERADDTDPEAEGDPLEAAIERIEKEIRGVAEAIRRVEDKIGTLEEKLEPLEQKDELGIADRR